MSLTGYPNLEPVLPTEEEAALAKASRHALLSHLQEHPSDEPLKLVLDENEGKKIAIPAAALPLLAGILAQISYGNTVKLTPLTKELHIYQAANILGVSDKYVWDLLDAEEIPYKIVDNCRRIRYEDVMDYKKRSYEQSMKGMDELVAESEALGLYD